MKTNIPFGLLFEENIQNIEIEPPQVIYSSTEQMSYTILETGEVEPYVKSTWTMGTETVTKVKAEGTVDDDQNVKMFTRVLGTETMTKVKAETTDSDEDSTSFPKKWILSLGTETATFVKNEDTDSDR